MFLTILYWRLLRKSKIFRYWYKKFLCELLYDIEFCDLDQQGIKEKYIKKLKLLDTI